MTKLPSELEPRCTTCGAAVDVDKRGRAMHHLELGTDQLCGNTRKAAIPWRERAIAAERQLKNLRHAAWHALDNAAEYPDAEDPHAEIPWKDYLALAKLLPEDHP